jgi:hypothetical protein
VKISATCSAIAALTGRLLAMTPPKAETGSVSLARRWASATSAPTAISARVGVLDDRHRRELEVIRCPIGSIGIDEVVVGHRLPVQLVRTGDATVGMAETYMAAC